MADYPMADNPAFFWNILPPQKSSRQISYHLADDPENKFYSTGPVYTKPCQQDKAFVWCKEHVCFVHRNLVHWSPIYRTKSQNVIKSVKHAHLQKKHIRVTNVKMWIYEHLFIDKDDT